MKKKNGRPRRGEGTTVVGVRLSDTLCADLRKVATAWGVPLATVLRAGGVAFARGAARAWTKEATERFLEQYGGAS